MQMIDQTTEIAQVSLKDTISEIEDHNRWRRLVKSVSSYGPDQNVWRGV